MKRFLSGAWKLLKGLPLALLTPALLVLSALALGMCDVVWAVLPRRKLAPDTIPNNQSASVVIPNWNGRELLEKYLPSVIDAMSGSAQNEIIVVENNSSDGSAEFVRQHFPQ